MTDPADLNLDDLRRRARRRLIGAVVLALAAAVVVPMLLESEPRPLGEDVTVKIPSIDEGRFVNRLQGKDKEKDRDRPPARAENPKSEAATPEAAKAEPAKEESAPADAAKSGSGGETPGKQKAAEPPRRSLAEAEQKVLAAPASAPAKAAATEPPKAPPAAPPKAPPAAASTKADAGPTYSVQLAAFSDDKGANALANKLKRAGHSAYTEPLETSKGTLWRVRVGPFPTRDDAVAAREKLKGEGQIGIVAPSR